VPGWICPECGRLFGRTGQSHDCAPGMTLEEYFSTGPAHERPVFDAVMHHLATVGPVHADVVSVGIFLKNPRKFAELRPMQRWVALSFSLSRVIEHPKITRRMKGSSRRTYHVVRLYGPIDVDEDVRAWLTESYFEA
jgi:hypothetical protein